MEEEYSVSDPTLLLISASDFAFHPGFQSDSSTKEFLDRFPLPVIINALQTKGDVPGLENALVACLERIFKTKYGASLIPQYMPFIVVGLGADSQKVRCVACKTVSCLLENSDETTVSAARLVIEYDVYPLLLKCLTDGDEQVAAAAMDAIRNFAGSAEGMDIIFPANTNEATHLRNVAAGCSSLGRVRVLALIVKLFSISSSVATVVYNSNLLSPLEAEISNVNDTLAALSVLELFYELAEIQHSTEFLSRTTLLQLLSTMISNASIGSILRARAMMIIGRLMSKENVFMFIDESAIQGATLLLSNSPPAARHVVDAAFDRHGHGKQLAALHALGNIAGETRSESNRMLNVDGEENLRVLIYETASKSSKLTPSGLFLSVLQQDSEIRLAGYRLIAGLTARPWCLMEICSRQEIINIVTDAFTETTKIGMEARHNCCQAIRKALMSSPKLASDPNLAGIAAKLEEAVRRGPYLARKHSEAQPAVMTAERF
ncbi:uncharacterized protein LOC114319503 isoform X2 [Camellia sinensis]|uniref:uncharacterized protein LOC114319503 isoform X2 n=1 Tax=Camellia sinensis TaxID=4442 RepID=UPI0010357A86|nr:uncharacterized protein LOC114319503 isoform X2 [Camellia sinensis]